MAIILEGTVTNKIINGVNGEFSVGNFVTDIGQFKIRSALLDQFEEGEYQVKVTVNNIGLNSYMSKRNGIIITEMDLDIDHLQCIESDVKPIPAEQIQPDASVETKSQKPDTQIKSKTSKPKTSTTSKSDRSNDTELSELFGHLWPLGNTVKLDSTTPRPIFIQQKDYLKNNGYTFNGDDQTFRKED